MIQTIGDVIVHTIVHCSWWVLLFALCISRMNSYFENEFERPRTVVYKYFHIESKKLRRVLKNSLGFTCACVCKKIVLKHGKIQRTWCCHFFCLTLLWRILNFFEISNCRKIEKIRCGWVWIFEENLSSHFTLIVFFTPIMNIHTN